MFVLSDHGGKMAVLLTQEVTGGIQNIVVPSKDNVDLTVNTVGVRY